VPVLARFGHGFGGKLADRASCSWITQAIEGHVFMVIAFHGCLATAIHHQFSS
jgi:hypothetical protein